MQPSTSQILSACDEIFNIETCHRLARLSGFIQRSSSKIYGHEFLKTLVLPSNGLSEDSLNGLCERMRDFNPQANISASALIQRMNTTSAVKFMKMCFEKTLLETQKRMTKQYSSLEGALRPFKNTYIQDSTVIELNKQLSKFFPGTVRGGKKGSFSCKSQVKIDLIHNFTTGQIANVEMHEGKLPDQALCNKIENMIKKDDLIIRDLGYFKIKSLRAISEKNAYFLSRFPSHVKVYLNRDDKEPTDLAEYFNKHYKYSSTIDLTVWISDERLQVRLVTYRLPKDVVKERLRKAKKTAKSTGRTLSKGKLALLEFSLFVTNAPGDKVSVNIIGTIYRIRWEIELIFKSWKSCLKISVLEGICVNRINCLIWSRLCTVLLIAQISAGFFNLAIELYASELSPTKLVKYLLRNGILCKAIQMQRIQELERRMIKDMKKRLLKDKRCRSSMRQGIINSEYYYEECA